MKTGADTPAPPPLMAWDERRRLGQMLRERESLRARLQHIDPRSTRRIAAEKQLAALTTEILAAELRLTGGRR